MTFNEIIQQVDNEITKYFSNLKGIDEPLLSAVRYSVLNGGKRLRPLMCFIGAGINDYEYKDILGLAIAVECIHCYSLVHDDLPSMDNDVLRRGKPTTHIRFGEGMAVLTGDALLNLGMEILLESSLRGNSYLNASRYIAKEAGIYGMIGGQCVDIASEQLSVEQIVRMYSLKTGSLFKAALVGGAIASGADKDEIKSLDDYATALGIAYQISDDILDINGDCNLTGKNTGSDANNKRSTLINLIGYDKTLELKRVYEQKAREAASRLKINKVLIELLNMLILRDR